MMGYPTVQGLEYTRCPNFTNISLENFTICSEERLYVFTITNQTTDQRDQNIPKTKHTLIMTQTQLKLSATQKAKLKQNRAETQNKPKNKQQKDVKNSEQNIHKNVTRIKQNQSSNTPEFTINKTPPEKIDENYPTILNTTTKQKQEKSTDQNRTEKQTIISETQIIPETQTSNSSPHTPTNDDQQPELPKSNISPPEQHKMTNTQIQSPSPTLVSNRFRLLQDTPKPENINTPDLNTDINPPDINTPDTTSTSNETENEILTPTSPTPKTKRQIHLEARLFKTKKFTT